MMLNNMNRRIKVAGAACLATGMGFALLSSRQMAAEQPVASLTAITAVGVKQPVRQPHWFRLPNHRLGLLWRYPVLMHAHRGPDFPWLLPQTYTQIGYAFDSGKGFSVSPHILEIGPGQFRTGELATAYVPSSQTSLIFSQRGNIGDFYSVARANVRTLSGTPEAADGLAVAQKDTALLPFDSTSPDWVKAYTAYAASISRDAARDGHKAFLEEEMNRTTGPRPQTGDGIISRERVFCPEDFSRFSATTDQNNTVWLVGTDNYKAGLMWAIPSKDSGKHWGARVLLGVGNFPTLVASAKQMTFIYTKMPKYGYQGVWPDDGPRRGLRLGGYNWPAPGSLMQRRSLDGGRTWKAPQPVLKDNQVIESRAVLASDGRIWLVYVRSDADPRQERTSLWLTSSGDGGKSWNLPRALTDGKFLDREPDMIADGGKIRIAFSRAGRGIDTNIWLAEVDPKTW